MTSKIKTVILDVSNEFPAPPPEPEQKATDTLASMKACKLMPMTQLTSYCMKYRIPKPHLEITNAEGESHTPIFTFT